MNDSLDDELRRSLHTHADQLPRRPDFSRGAITRAKGIRRRRRVASGIAAAALVAVALPLGLKVGDLVSNGQEQIEPAPRPTGPTRIGLDLGSLPSDDAPGLPYLDGRTVVGDGLSIDVPGSSPIAGIAPVSDGVYVATGDGSDGWLVTRYAADGSADEIGRVRGTPVSSADGQWVAYLTGDADRSGNPAGDATLVLVDDQTGETSTVALPDADPYGVAIHAIVDGTVYFSYDRGPRAVPLQTWSADDPAPQPVSGDFNATAVSPDGRLVAHLTKLIDFGSCSAITDRETGEALWRTCKYTIRGFSPDGEYVWAGPAYADGYGATMAAILDARTGELIRRYEPVKFRQQITFHDAVFEDDDTLLINAEQNDAMSLVRCEALTEDCGAAEPLVDGDMEPPGSPPYLLPDAR